MFGKFKIRYLLFFMVLSFGMMRNCYATRYWFNYDEKLFNSLCSATDSLGCKVQCKDGNEFPAGPTIGVGCSSASDIKKFSYDADFKRIEDLKTLLQNFKTGSNQVAYDYVRKTYCKNWKSDEQVCKQLKQVSGKPNTTTCKVRLIAYNFEQDVDKQDYSQYVDAKFAVNILSDGSGTLKISSSDSNFVLDSDGAGATVYGTNHFSFYFAGSKSKIDKFNEFKDDYISKVKNGSCPSLTFCGTALLKTSEESGGSWVVTSEKNCKDIGFILSGGARQISDSIGQNSGITFDLKNKDNKDLISDEKIEFLNCKSLIGDRSQDGSLASLLHTLVVAVRIAVPIILIVLGSMDFAQAVFSSSEDSMKKTQSKFMKRLIIAVIIFLIPSFLGVILRIANSIWGNIDPTFCGIL